MTFLRFSLLSLALTLFVIVWGGYVRASGSGAGCGDHWPNCNGQIIPRDPTTKTIIEFTHRATSGLAFLSVLALVIWSNKSKSIPSRARKSAQWSLVFMISEALVGALLVKAELVANNATASRAVVISIHLVNTFLLLFALSSAVLHAHVGDKNVRFRSSSERTASIFSLVMIVLVGISGAIAALGDTLVQQSVVSALTDSLIQLRIWHPLLAILGVGSGMWVIKTSTRSVPKNWLISLGVFLGIQVTAGLVNVVLQAPIYMQLVHLFLADCVWMLLVCIGELQTVEQ
jgi:heme a synthase